jgi:hypothetical protein
MREATYRGFTVTRAKRDRWLVEYQGEHITTVVTRTTPGEALAACQSVIHRILDTPELVSWIQQKATEWAS